MLNDMPEFLTELVKAENDTTRGKVGVELVKNNGAIVGAQIKRQTIVNFPQPDSRKVVAALTQKILDSNKNQNERENINIRLEVKKGEITRMFITDEYQLDMK